jgi:signal transduction histidine kinase
MHPSGVGFTAARAVPGPGIELEPILGMEQYRARDRAPLWALVAATAASVAAGLALAGHPSDIFPTFAYSTLIGAGASAIAIQRQRRATTRAIDEERRRIARDLHDGLAQELAYIKMEAQRMAAIVPGGRAERVAQAAERALAESRGAIAALRGDGDEAFLVELSELADELTSREGARLSLQLDPGIEIEREDREALLRIMREAISNGVRHGHATEVALELTGGKGLRMAVRDNGAGFVPGGPRRRRSFGLTSMSERARALGGNLTVESAPGEGTTVEVNLP